MKKSNTKNIQSKTELLKRIEDLEKRVANLETWSSIRFVKPVHVSRL